MADKQPELAPQAPAENAGRGRGRGGRRGGRGRGRGRDSKQQSSRPKQVPEPADLDSLLAPKALGGKPTSPKNDPLLHSLFTLAGVNGFVERRRDSEFQLDFSQYITLVEESYTSLITCDRGLAKFVPQCAYQYYMVLALWKRIYQVVSTRYGIDTYKKIHGVVPEMYVTEEIKLYLDGIGNMTDAGCKTWYFKIKDDLLTDQQHFGVFGSYGRVDHNTHVYYETLPAPIISIMTMIADIFHSKGENRDWALVADMQPEAHAIPAVGIPDHDGYVPPRNVASGNPNTNLLGYRQAKALSNDQLAVLVDNGITVGDNWNNVVVEARNIDRIPVLVSLVQYLTGQFKNSKCVMHPYITDSIVGSLAQVPFTKRDPGDIVPDRNQRAVAKLGTTVSYRQTISDIAVASIMYRYRFKRKRNDNTRDCYCYFFADGDQYHVPAAWIANENSIYDALEKWNIDDFTSATQDGRGVLVELTSKTKKKAER